MIITKTPLRIPLGGGGTDLPEFYSQFGGHLLTAAVNRHIFVFVQKWFEDGIKVSYSKTEIVQSVDDIQHPAVREALRHSGISNHIEVLSMAELPSQTGLGSSSTYTVGLLKALGLYTGMELGTKELAELACHLQMDILREPGGKQDQYAAAFGGLLSLEIDHDGAVEVTRLPIEANVLEELQHNLIYFYTGISRKAVDVQSTYSAAVGRNEKTPVEALLKIKEIGLLSEKALLAGRLDEFGSLLDEHWMTKQKISKQISNDRVNELYCIARKAGAYGGKLMGAGGGGFLMIYCPTHKKQDLRQALTNQGLQEVKFQFEFEGSRVLLNV
jgi:D-glycero-alpha-D-manno-heptose-7-phosphate kinase